MRKNGLTHQRVICTAHSRLDTPRSVTDTRTTMPIDSEATKTGTGDVISFLKCIYTVNVQVSQIRSKHSLPVANGSRAGWRWAPERDESFSQAGHLSEHFSASGPRCVPFVRRALFAVHHFNQTVPFSDSRIGSVASVGYVSNPNFDDIFETATAHAPFAY
jgi:hypothetical protein